jgi:hypothetical protein
MYLRICGSFLSPPKLLGSTNCKSEYCKKVYGLQIGNLQVAKITWAANRKSASCNICGRSARPVRQVRQPYAGINFIPPVRIYEFGYRYASYTPCIGVSSKTCY